MFVTLNTIYRGFAPSRDRHSNRNYAAMTGGIQRVYAVNVTCTCTLLHVLPAPWGGFVVFTAAANGLRGIEISGFWGL